jgi:hypothetical protein
MRTSRRKYWPCTKELIPSRLAFGVQWVKQQLVHAVAPVAILEHERSGSTGLGESYKTEESTRPRSDKRRPGEKGYPMNLTRKYENYVNTPFG